MPHPELSTFSMMSVACNCLCVIVPIVCVVVTSNVCLPTHCQLATAKKKILICANSTVAVGACHWVPQKCHPHLLVPLEGPPLLCSKLHSFFLLVQYVLQLLLRSAYCCMQYVLYTTSSKHCALTFDPVANTSAAVYI